MSPRPSPHRSSLRARRAFALFVLLALGSLAGTASWRLTAGSEARASSSRAAPALPSRYSVSAADADAAVRRFAALGRPLFCGGGNERVVALTFDDGPGPYTRDTVATLRRAGARATFFFVGKRLREGWIRPEEVLAVGAVGNHSWNHVSLAGGDGSLLSEEIDATTAALEERMSTPVTLFRPPYGARDDASAAHVADRGMIEVLWTFDSGDSAAGALARTVMKTLRREIRPGAIVLLHENRGSTHTSLGAILELLAERRLQPVTVPELLAIDPPSERQLRAGTCP